MYVPMFGEIRPLLSRVDRYSICMQETGEYENYRFLCDVPERYDALYVFGIGLVDTEFYEPNGIEDDPYDDPSGIVVMSKQTAYRPSLEFRQAIEVMLSKEPRTK